LESHGTNLCALHKRIDEATAMLEKYYAETNISEILSIATSSIPLCENAKLS